MVYNVKGKHGKRPIDFSVILFGSRQKGQRHTDRTEFKTAQVVSQIKPWKLSGGKTQKYQLKKCIHFLLYCVSVLRFRDPVPFWPLAPGWVKSQDPDPGWTTRIIFPRAYKSFFWVKIQKKFLSGSGMEKSRIRDKYPISATLPCTMVTIYPNVKWGSGPILAVLQC
jgi:hypothetical protein